MSEPLGRIDVRRRSGEEAFHSAGRLLGFELVDFWRWASSDLTSNALRGVLAEYLVARALDAHLGVRTEWDACDVCAQDGTRIEVKSAAYIQSWSQRTLSTPSFGIAPARGWDAATNTSAADIRRAADIYVFALLHHRDKATIDPLDVSQWTFYILPAAILDARCPTQKQIRLAPLLALEPVATDFEGLAAAIAALRLGEATRDMARASSDKDHAARAPNEQPLGPHSSDDAGAE